MSGLDEWTHQTIPRASQLKQSRRVAALSSSPFIELATRSLPLVFSNILNGLVSTGIVFLTARLLTPSEFGTYASILGVVLFAVAAVSGGVGAWATRQIAHAPDEASWIVPTMLRWYAFLFISFPLAVTFVFLVLKLPYELIIAGGLLTAYAVLRARADGLCSYLFAHGATGTIAVGNVIETILSAIFITTFVLLGFGIVGIAFGEILATSGRSVFISRDVAIRRRDETPSASPLRLILLLRSSSPLWAVQVIYAGSARLQPVAIGLQSTSIAGAFVVGSRFVESGLMLTTPMSSVLLPMLTQVRSDAHRFRRLLSLGFVLSLVIGTIIGVTLLAFADTIVLRLLGSQYRSLLPAMPFIALNVVLAFLVQMCSTALVALGLERFMARSVLGLAIALVIGLAVLSRSLGLAALFVYVDLLTAVTILIWAVQIRHHTMPRISLSAAQHNDDALTTSIRQ